jgi:hypothetical protein
MIGLYQILTQGVHSKAYIGPAIRQIHQRTNNRLYRVASTNSDKVSTRSFNFVSMVVFMALLSNISNLFNISTAYFPWLRKIFSRLYKTSRPKK